MSQATIAGERNVNEPLHDAPCRRSTSRASAVVIGARRTDGRRRASRRRGGPGDRGGQFPDLVQPDGAEGVQPRRLDLALVLVPGGAARLQRHCQGGARLRDGLLGRRDEPLVSAVVPAERGGFEGRLRSGREGQRRRAEDRAREGLCRGDRRVLQGLRQGRPQDPRDRLREGDGAALRPLPRRPGGRRLLFAGAERDPAADRQDLCEQKESGRDPGQRCGKPSRTTRASCTT